MSRSFPGLYLLSLLLSGAVAAAAAEPAQTDAVSPQQLYDRTLPSLVAVEFTLDHELGHQDLVGEGIVVSEDGLIMTSLGLVDPRLPDAQCKDFKIIVLHTDRDDEMLDATFLGRDERTSVAFFRTQAKRKWTPLKFEPVDLHVGDPVYSVGLLPKAGGYRPYFTSAVVSAKLRSELPQVMVTPGGLAVAGSPVFDARGRAIGFVNFQSDPTGVLLNDPNGSIRALLQPPRFFVATKDFQISLDDPPQGIPLRLPWIGIPVTALNSLKHEMADFFGLKDQPAIEIGDVIPGGPADKAGLQRGQIILQLNHKPLERTDDPTDVGARLVREILGMKVGDKITLSVMTKPGQPLTDVSLTLEEVPKGTNLAERFYAQDLGFVVRQIVFNDTYVRHLPADTGGLIVALVSPQNSAQFAHLQINDLVTKINNIPITGLDQFRQAYQDFRRDKPREAVLLEVMRDSAAQVIRIEPQ